MPCRAFRRNRAAGTLALLVALAAGGASGGAQAQGLLTQAGGAAAARSAATGGLSVRRFEDWQVVCDSRAAPPVCRISTEARPADAAPGGPSVEIGADIAADAAGEIPIFTVLTPLDLLVAKGVELRVDDGPPLRLAYRSCHVQGCLVPFRLDAAMAGRFRRGAGLRLRLFALDGTPVDLDASLLGFTAALDAAR